MDEVDVFDIDTGEIEFIGQEVEAETNIEGTWKTYSGSANYIECKMY